MQVNFHKHFDKSYKKCSANVRTNFQQRLKLFLEDPYNRILNNHALHGEGQDFRSINVTGDYRALYHHLNYEIVEFVIIDTHSNLYK